MADRLWLYEVEVLAELHRQSERWDAIRAATEGGRLRSVSPLADSPVPVRSTDVGLLPLSAPLPLAVLGLVIARRRVLAGSSVPQVVSLPSLDTRLELIRRLKAGLRWLRSSLRGVF